MATIKELLVYKILREIYRWSYDYFIWPLINLANRIKIAAIDHFWEKKLGIKTADNSQVQDDATMFKDSLMYAPTPYHVIELILNRLQFSRDDVFIDLGCGKGRVLLTVAMKNLKKVIGIEARKDMFDIAIENLKRSNVKNTPVEIVNADVATFDMREGTIFFMYNPFGVYTHKCVMEHIKNSLIVNPRQVRIIYYGGGPDIHDIDGYNAWLVHKNRFFDIYNVDIWYSKFVEVPRL
ncbi:MAG: methyltransferase domain-containing protein [Candidatus Omnitrophota bacterium]